MVLYQTKNKLTRSDYIQQNQLRCLSEGALRKESIYEFIYLLFDTQKNLLKMVCGGYNPFEFKLKGKSIVYDPHTSTILHKI